MYPRSVAKHLSIAGVQQIRHFCKAWKRGRCFCCALGIQTLMQHEHVCLHGFQRKTSFMQKCGFFKINILAGDLSRHLKKKFFLNVNILLRTVSTYYFICMLLVYFVIKTFCILLPYIFSKEDFLRIMP